MANNGSTIALTAAVNQETVRAVTGHKGGRRAEGSGVVAPSDDKETARLPGLETHSSL